MKKMLDKGMKKKGYKTRPMPSYKASPAESTEGTRSTAQIPDFVKRFNRGVK